jgi:hypothetical protein
MANYPQTQATQPQAENRVFVSAYDVPMVKLYRPKVAHDQTKRVLLLSRHLVTSAYETGRQP